MTMIGSNDIVSLYIGYVEGRGGKSRPVLVTEANERNLSVYRITSKYENKSKYIKEQYYKIQNWKEAGLKKPSWVDLGKIQNVKTDAATSIKKIGSMSDEDVNQLGDQVENVARSRVKNAFRDKLSEMVYQELKTFLEENKIPRELVSVDRIVQSITDSQVDINADEIVEIVNATGNINYSVVNRYVTEFIRESYDADYIAVKVAQKVNPDILKAKIIQDLVDKLSITSPYKAIGSSYWVSKLNKAESIGVLYEYFKTDDLVGLADRCFPEWKEFINADDE